MKNNIDEWLNVTFESSGGKTKQFSDFVRNYKRALIDKLPGDYTLEEYIVGHFEVSAFIKDTQGRYIYLSIPDVRYFRNEWYYNILIRTAKNSKDYSGGSNWRATMDRLAQSISGLYDLPEEPKV